MKKIISTAVACLILLGINAQQEFTIKGSIKRITGSKQIKIYGNGGQFTIPISDDGTFIFSGKTTDSGVALILTDSSGANAFWLSPGDYTMIAKEIPGVQFRIDKLDGPADARIYHAYSEPRFYIGSVNKDEIAAKYTAFYVNFFDSIFTAAPNSQTIPEMLRLAAPSIPDEKVKGYLSRFNEEQKKDGSTVNIKEYYLRKDKITQEKKFMDFTMTDSLGKAFTLHGLKKKLILIDFWSSDCMPCRSKHTGLVKLYEKYADKGLEIVSVALDEDAAAWKKAIIKDRMSWINVSDLKGWNTPLAKSYYVSALPTAFWLNKDQEIIGEYLSNQEIEKILSDN